MAIDTDIFSGDLAEIESDIAQTFTWHGASYACVAGDAEHVVDFSQDGYTPQRSVQIHVRTDLFDSAQPGKGQIVTYDSHNYRIETATPSPGGEALVLDCAQDV